MSTTPKRTVPASVCKSLFIPCESLIHLMTEVIKKVSVNYFSDFLVFVGAAKGSR